MAMRVSVDRALPVPIGVQLKGAVEYGIVSGALKPGTRLPSVRELAAAEGIAHVTVSHVYRDLKRDGLIVVRPGQGTYVADSNGADQGNDKTDLYRLVDTMVTQALKSGYWPAEISHVVTARLTSGHSRRPSIALVGLFAHATEWYAHDMAALLADLAPDVAPYTVDDLVAGGAEIRSRVCRADVVLTIANRVKEVRELLGPDAPSIHALAFVAHPATVRRLRALPRGLKLGVISLFAEFLPTMAQGMTECVSIEEPLLCAVLSDTARVQSVALQADAIVYASGAAGILAHVPPGTPAIEYLHTPEPSSVAAVRPLLERVAGIRAHTTQSNGQRR